MDLCGFFLANVALVLNKLYIICTDLTVQVFKSFFTYLWVWNITFYIVLCQWNNKNIFIPNIDDQITTYMFAFKSTHVA